MSDREKVIKGLEETEIMLSQAVDRGGSMSVIGAFNCLNRVTNTIALLKEQEEAFYPNILPNIDSTCYLCGNCKIAIFPYGAHYCHNCGRKVKWDE